MKISGSSSNLPPRILSARAIVRMFHRFESATRNSNLSFAQYRILGFLQNGPHRAGELALAAAVKKPTVSTVLNGLRRRRWISERTDPVDGRVVTLVLTPSGRKRLRALDDQLAKTLEACIAKADLPMMFAALVRLYASLNATGHADARRNKPHLSIASDRRKTGS
jgi:DNA-binding MarR family transcriptional regulator